MLPIIVFAVLVNSIGAQRTVTHKNNCPDPIWISPLANEGSSALPEGILVLNNGESKPYQIPDTWGGRFTPKQGCNGDGQGCQVGQSMDPCNEGGCSPPADTKVEFFFPELDSGNTCWYDISLVDGYSLPVKIDPITPKDACIPTNCQMSLDSCPTNENDVGSLVLPGQCFSPCKKWNWPEPKGLGKDETEEPGVQYCCPQAEVSSEQCNAGKVMNTQYVQNVHNQCPTAYAFAFDDEGGLHNCPAASSFTVTWCP